ncbi:MAG: PQQ-binding-like beta-propeller repeat protein, partial [Planctomycetota bacterium]
FAGMDASCYESYTDYGVWPMSAAFTTDWARAERPGYPVWITVDWGLSSETQPKSLLHAFVRGLGGGGAPMQADQGWRTLQQRGRAVRFLQQVASIRRHATPDRRFGILTTLGQKVLDGRAYYTYHALYYHLTRLGAPPVLLPEERFQESGLPDDLRVLFIARQQAPFAPETEKMLAEFAARGGRIVATGDSDFVPEGATVLDPPLRNIWQLSGFRPDSHGDMWKQFLGTWRKPLTDALDAAGAPRFATTDPEQGLALGTTVGPIRYVAVIADPAGTHWAHFKPADALQISLEGTGWTVRNLATQETLDTTPADGRTGVTVPLVNEPATLLALLPSPPAAVTVRAKGTIVAGGRVAYTAAVTAEDGSDLGAAPMRFTLRDPAGAVRQTRYYAAGDELTYRLPVLDAAGAWTVDAQELLTGRTASLTVPVTATEPVAVEPVEPVHVVNAAHLRTFVRRAGPVWILLEPGQEARQAEADRLAEAVRARGREVRVWTVPPEAFAPHPLRWFPRAEDRARLERIERGELIGYRIDLTPYIDEEKAVHVPERGGYGAIDPPYMVGADCVLFSGGRLAESLRAVSPWLPTPSLPARGEARLLTLFSPFLADRHAVVIGAHDDDGYTRGAERLAAAFAHADGADTPADAIAGTEANPGEWTLAAKGEAEAAVPTPYRNYIPTRRIRRLLASPAGTAVFLTGKQDNLVFVGPDGAVTGSHRVPDDLHRDAHMDSTGRVWGVAGRITARHPGWHYPTAYELLLQGVGPDGLVGSLVAYAGDTSHLPPEHRQAFAVAPDGAHAALGRLSGFLTGPLADPAGWQRYDDLPHVRHRWEVRNPRWPVGVTWSPDSRYVLATLDTRPRMGGMGTPQFAPYACETVLVDTQTGRRLWGLRGEADNDGRYAFARPFGSVAANGVVAFADCAGRACIVAPDGRILLEEPIGVPVGHGDRLSSIKGGVGVVQSPDGRLAVFAMAGAVHLAAVTEQAATLHPVAIPNVHSVALLPDGPQVLVGTRGGVVVALDPDGRERWRTEPGGIDSVVAAAGSDRAVVATSDGVLVGLDAAGTETWRTDLAAVADAGTHALAKAEAFKPLPAPLDYRDPGTLALAKAHLGAERLAAWQPAGEGRPALGHTWHPFEGEARLDGNAKEAFLHLVYRRPEGNNALRVTTEGGDGKRTFELDLPTPTWRVVDLPVRGPDVRVTVTADGPVEIAALSLWSLRWPGANVAYVRPPDSGGAGAADLLGDDDDDMGIGDDLDIGIGELEGGGAALHGKMKDCLFYAWNPDPDQVSGPFLNVPAPPLKVVDGKRFQFGKLKWMTDAKDSYRGLWWTVAFPEPVKARFVAVYDLRAKQSETANNIGVFTEFAAEGPGYANTGRVLAGAVENDQFWRLFPLDGTPRDLLGVQVYRGDSVPEGLSEVEVY